MIDAKPEQAAMPPRAVDPDHRHVWQATEFFLADDHPWFRQSCTCGATRKLKAWERYWQTPAAIEHLAAP
jgi:hypothetical protein